MLETQKYIREYGLEALNREFAIKITPHSKYPNLIGLKYNQIESTPRDHKIIKECRGLILDKDNDYNIIACPFFRFFNMGEGIAASIDYNNAKCYTKHDGSFIILNILENCEYNIATSGMPDATGCPGNGYSGSFADLFKSVMKQRKYTWPLVWDFTFMFELVTPYNKQVVQYKESDIIFLGCRDNETLQEYTPEGFKAFNDYGWHNCESFDFKDKEIIIDVVNRLNPLEQEGFVVCDNNFNRVKIKNEDYVRLHHMISGFTLKDAVGVVRNGEIDEVVASFPEWKDRLWKINDGLISLHNIIGKSYDEIKDIKIQKDFAMIAKELPIAAPLFCLRSGKASNPGHYLTEIISVEGLIELFNKTGINIE